MMLRRVVSVRSSAAWRSALRVQTARAQGRRDVAAVSALATRAREYQALSADGSGWHIGGVRLLTSAAAPASHGATEAATATAEAKESLISQLRPLCSALYTENRSASSSEDLLLQWHSQITALMQHESMTSHPELLVEIQRAYEQGVAIAMKQREFELARALIEQMKQLTLPPTDHMFEFQIRAVALQWVTRERPLSLAELRELDLGANWEHTLLELVRTEDQPHHRKSELEREQYHEHLRTGVAAVLADYEANVDKTMLRVGPYNAALRVYASNKLPFTAMIRLLNQIPRDSHARTSLDVETFVALLQGARWQDIPNTIERLMKSNMLRKLFIKPDSDVDQDDRERSHTIALIWDQAMRSLCNSYTEQVLDQRPTLDRHTVRELQAIYKETELQLLRAFPEKRFATIEDQNAVYEIRVKTAAMLGLSRQVHELLDEYKALAPVEFASGQLGKSVFLKALEVFPSIGLKRVSSDDVDRVRSHPDVLESPEVFELQRACDDLTKSIPAQKSKLKVAQSSREDGAAIVAKDIGRELRKDLQTITKFKKRIDYAVTVAAVKVAHQHRIQAADRSVDSILKCLVEENNDTNPLMDVEVAVALMNQYMTLANRFVSRMAPHTREFMEVEVMERVFDLLHVVVGDGQDGNSRQYADEQDRVQVKQLFALATKTAALFWSDKDVEDLLRLKKKVLRTETLDAEDYDRLVFLRVHQLDLGGAYQLMQEMHFAGTAPTPVTIHRVVMGVMHKLYRPQSKEDKGQGQPTVKEANAADDHEDEGVMDAYEDEEPVSQSWSAGPACLDDLPSFIQEWYNLYRVKPMARTVVPIFARQLGANKIWEVKRFLQILDAMDGGLTPVTEFWLEKRLESVGKSLADLRYTSKKR